MVAEYVASVKAAWELAKSVKSATDAIEDADIKYQMAELISALAHARIEAAQSAERIAELERELRSKSTFEFDGSKYFKLTEGDVRQGPFCPSCYDADGKEVRLHYINDELWGDWTCYVCERYFDKPNDT